MEDSVAESAPPPTAGAPSPAADRNRQEGTVDRWVGVVVAVATPVLAGLLSSLVMPHGPANAAQALLVMATSLGVGVVAGWGLGSRWSFLVAPMAYALAYELGRLGAVGPTVDAPRLDEAYGILALVLGRGFHGLLAFAPMILGASFGAAARRRQTTPPGETGTSVARRAARLLPWAVGILVVGGLAVAVALPPSTPPIIGADGRPVEGAIAELATVRLGGADQRILVRAQDPAKPVLLWLAGGPGQTDMALFRAIMDDLTRDFVVVNWDQRGTGGSYAAIDPEAEMTLDRVVADTVELADYLRERFDEERIYLAGLSWGSTLGVLAAQAAPDRFHAFIGNGQMVSQRETDRRIYDDLLAYADRTGDLDLRTRMEDYGRPPYADLPYAYAFVMGYYEALEEPYTPSAAYTARGEAAGLDPFGVLGSEYDLVAKANVLRGLIDMFTVIYPQLQEIDFRTDVPRLEVPYYLVDGTAELAGRRDLALEWYAMLDAPIKQILSLDGAAHAPALEQYEAFHRFLVETVVPETYGGE
jgi:pimeloyl-ACP methyl ester carboxylesterase